MKLKVWGVIVSHNGAAKALGQSARNGSVQVRVLVLARSRLAAARYFANAGFYWTAGAADYHLQSFGATTGNTAEIAACTCEGQVYVTNDSAVPPSQRHIIPWPPT